MFKVVARIAVDQIVLRLHEKCGRRVA